MPFKSSRITYGLPQEAYDREEICSCLLDLHQVLPIERKWVGISFIFDEEAYDKCCAEEVKGKLPYCVMVKQASEGKSSKSRLSNHNCDGGTTALGLEPSTQRIESGQEYFSYHLYQSNAAARRMRSQVQSLHKYQAVTYGMLIEPLEECTEKPDVVIGIVNPYQAMRVIQGYEYHCGVKPQIDMGAMQGMCSESTAVPYLTGELNVSVMCPSTRMLCKWAESEMLLGIPFEQFQRVTEGVIATKPSY